MGANAITHNVKTSTTMIGNFMYHGTYETYLGELMSCVKPSAREDCENEVANVYLDMLSDIINDHLPDDVEDSFEISYSGMYHPRFYNFETDAIEFSISFNGYFKSYLGEYAEDNREFFDKFLHDNFTSRDGFYSYTTNNFDDWSVGFVDDDFRCVSVIIWYFLAQECDEESETPWFYERIHDVITENFVDSEFAVRYNNGYVGYCVSGYDNDYDCDRSDACLFDNDGNVVTAHMYDYDWECNGSAYAAWDWVLESKVTNNHENVGYDYDEMDIREFHKLYNGKF